MSGKDRKRTSIHVLEDENSALRREIQFLRESLLSALNRPFESNSEGEGDQDHIQFEHVVSLLERRVFDETERSVRWEHESMRWRERAELAERKLNDLLGESSKRIAALVVENETLRKTRSASLSMRSDTALPSQTIEKKVDEWVRKAGGVVGLGEEKEEKEVRTESLIGEHSRAAKRMGDKREEERARSEDDVQRISDARLRRVQSANARFHESLSQGIVPQRRDLCSSKEEMDQHRMSGRASSSKIWDVVGEGERDGSPQSDRMITLLPSYAMQSQ
eukprot:TRINITY_DN15381_c0_g1_i2.p1 TRINITY_DN15381_c0_g1~~TRINITY_DN15381_c0_g1_i2.p1  ORF type:complete len:278 (+),score=96.03 TRINITY_DN15381_c0_g1_i2:913-1746(+)